MCFLTSFITQHKIVQQLWQSNKLTLYTLIFIVPKFPEMVNYPFQRNTNRTKIEDIWDGERYSCWFQDKSMLGNTTNTIVLIHSYLWSFGIHS